MFQRAFFFVSLVRVRALSFHRTQYITEGSVKPMPNRGPVPCAHPGCPRVVPYGQRYCSEHTLLYRGDRKSSGKRGYGSKWQRARARFLARPENIFCVECKKEGKLVRATVVDHIVPHRGDDKLFWDEKNWQPLCKKHHDIKTWNEDANPTYTF